MRTLYMKVIYPSALPCSARLRLRHRNNLGKTTRKEKKVRTMTTSSPLPLKHPTNWSRLVLQSLTSSITKPKAKRGAQAEGGEEEKNFFYNNSFLHGVYVVPPLPLHWSFTHSPNLLAGQQEGPTPILKRDRRKAEHHVHASPYKKGRTPRGEELGTGRVVKEEYYIRREPKRKEDKARTFYNQTRSPTPPAPSSNFQPASPSTYNKGGEERKKCPNTSGNNIGREREKK